MYSQKQQIALWMPKNKISLLCNIAGRMIYLQDEISKMNSIRVQDPPCLWVERRSTRPMFVILSLIHESDPKQTPAH